ncbi:MAG: universal stress protein [Solirubrobacterales bacterium]
MSYKDILVHLDGGERDPLRVEAALALAERFGGRLTGLFARSEHYGPSVVARRGSEAFEAAARHSEEQFQAATAGSRVPSRWWRLAHGEPGHVVAETAASARFFDLVVLGQNHEDKDAPEELVEQVIMQSGRPVLVLPAVGSYPSIGSNVIVAWNAGREATRALHDAMPLIEQAGNVELLTIRPRKIEAGDQPLPPLGILDHLTAHGVKVVREVLAGEDIGIMDLLLSRAFDQGADLLVMGAHAGYHLPFFKGGGTRHILKHMTLPVLMAN